MTASEPGAQAEPAKQELSREQLLAFIQKQKVKLKHLTEENKGLRDEAVGAAAAAAAAAHEGEGSLRAKQVERVSDEAFWSLIGEQPEMVRALARLALAPLAAPPRSALDRAFAHWRRDAASAGAELRRAATARSAKLRGLLQRSQLACKRASEDLEARERAREDSRWPGSGAGVESAL